MVETNWLKGKNVLITGGSDGVGKELAKNMAGVCGKITLIARGKEKLEKAKKELEQKSSETRIEISPMDIMDLGAMKNLVEKIYEEEQVDVFINCAGGTHFYGLLEEMSHEDIEKIFTVNAKAPIHWLRELLPRMKHNKIKSGEKRAHILLMSSRSGERPLPKLSVYGAAKGSVEKLVEAVRAEYAKYGIAFTLISPGSINTAFAVSWGKEPQDAHNQESMELEEAVNPIMLALNSQFVINKISFESIRQWKGEPGVIREEEK